MKNKLILIFLILLFSNSYANKIEQIFLPLKLDMSYKEAKSVAKEILINKYSHIVIEANEMLPVRLFVLKNGIKVYAIFEYNEKIKKHILRYLMTTDKNFNYKNVKVGSNVQKAHKVLPKSNVDFCVGHYIAINGNNGIRFWVETPFRDNLPYLWKDDIISSVISCNYFHIIKEKKIINKTIAPYHNYFHFKNCYKNMTFNQWLTKKGKSINQAKLFDPIYLGMNFKEVKKIVKNISIKKLNFPHYFGFNLKYYTAIIKNDISITLV